MKTRNANKLLSKGLLQMKVKRAILQCFNFSFQKELFVSSL